MALDVAGLRTPRRGRLPWLADVQRPRRLVAQLLPRRRSRGRQARHQRVRLRRHRRVAPLADHRRRGRRRASCGRSCERAIDWVLQLQTPAGEVIWARERRRHPVVVRAADRLVVDRPLARVRGRPRRAASARTGPTGSCRLVNLSEVIRTHPDAFADKHRWAMDWYYPVLTGVLTGRRRPAAARRPVGTTFVMRRPGRALRLRRAVGDGGRDGRVRPRPPGRGRQRDRRPTCCAGPGPTAAPTAPT